MPPPPTDENLCSKSPWKCHSNGGQEVSYQNWNNNEELDGIQTGRDNPFHLYFFIIFVGLLIVCSIGFCWRFYMLFNSVCIKRQRRAFSGMVDNQRHNSRSYQRHHDAHMETSPSPIVSTPGSVWIMPVSNLPNLDRSHDNLTRIHPSSSGHGHSHSLGQDPTIDYNNLNFDPPPSYAEAVLIAKYGSRS